MTRDAVLEALGVLDGLSFYLTLAWRTALNNRGNRLVESGSLALAFFSLAGISNGIRNFPFWLGMCFLTLSLLFALTALFFVMQRVWRFARRRRSARAVRVDPRQGSFIWKLKKLAFSVAG
jgi:uncharacterized membrane protein